MLFPPGMMASGLPWKARKTSTAHGFESALPRTPEPECLADDDMQMCRFLVNRLLFSRDTISTGAAPVEPALQRLLTRGENELRYLQQNWRADSKRLAAALPSVKGL